MHCCNVIGPRTIVSCILPSLTPQSQSYRKISELQRTVITLSRDNKELNEKNEQLRRQLMDIGAKVRDGDRAEFKLLRERPITIVPRDVRKDHDRRRGTGLATSRVSFGDRTYTFCMSNLSTTAEVEGFILISPHKPGDQFDSNLTSISLL